MPATVQGILLTGTHAARPAFNAAGLPKGSLYACTTHPLIYQTDGSAWTTWADLAGATETLPATIFAAKGDLLGATANDTPAILPVGANDTILMAESAEATGLKWVAAGTPIDLDYDDVAAQGTADSYARSDHGHGMPSAGTPAEILSIPTAETDDTLVLAPDGAGGVEFRAETGGGGGAASPLVAQTAIIGISDNTATVLGGLPLIDGNVLIAAIISNQHTVTSITQTGVTWTKIDEGALLSGAFAVASLWKGVIGSGAKPGITVDLTGNNTQALLVAEFQGYAGTTASNGNGTQGSGADLVLGPISSSSGDLIVACITNTAWGTYAPTYGGLAGIGNAGFSTNQVQYAMSLLFKVSDGSSVSPSCLDKGNNMAGAWGVIT